MDMNNLPKTNLFVAYIYPLMYNRNDYLLLSLCCRKQGKRGNPKMFDNAGKKCKIIAKVMMVTGAITAILYAIFFIRAGFLIGPERLWMYILQAIVGMLLIQLAVWLSAVIVYAIGVAAENSEYIREHLEENEETEETEE